MLNLFYKRKGKIMEDMAQDFGWSLDDFWDDEPLTPEELEAEARAEAAHAREAAVGELYASQFGFD